MIDVKGIEQGCQCVTCGSDMEGKKRNLIGTLLYLVVYVFHFLFLVCSLILSSK
jgi:hypothetical protein